MMAGLFGVPTGLLSNHLAILSDIWTVTTRLSLVLRPPLCHVRRQIQRLPFRANISWASAHPCPSCKLGSGCTGDVGSLGGG